MTIPSAGAYAALFAVLMVGLLGIQAQAGGAEPGDIRAKPGFLFLELYSKNPRDLIEFLGVAGGFKVIRDEKNWFELRNDVAEVLINAGGGVPGGNQASDKPGQRNYGRGVEVGLVAADLVATRQAALKYKNWVVTEIRAQDWGQSDFRVLTPDGFYIRVTEPAK